MSWVVGFVELPDLSKKSFTMADEYITSVVRHNTDLEEFPSMCRNEPFKDTGLVFDTEEQAMDALEKHSRRDGDWYAGYHEDIKSKTVDRLNARLNVLKEEEQKYISEHHVSRVKAKFITCPKCESKVNKTYIGQRDVCPVCGASMLPKSTQDAIALHRKNIEKLNRKIDEEQAKANAKSKIRYVMYYEEFVD